MLTWLSLLAALMQAHAAPSDLTEAPSAAPVLDQAPIVVELFTSQGCPMCPSANQLLAEYGARDDIIALGWGVNYWDAYGWADEFARPEFIDRQKAYVEAGEARRVYTPHFVINGSPERLRFNAERIDEAVSSAQPVALMVLNQTDTGAVAQLSGDTRAQPAEVWAAYYQPGVDVRTIENGRNAGLEMTHYNMVRSVVKLGEWTGGNADFPIPEAPEEGLACAILVQDGPGGRVLAANRLPPAP